MEEVSKDNIFGRYVSEDDDLEIFISIKNSILEIVHRSMPEQPKKVYFMKCELGDLSSEIKDGTCIGQSSISDKDVLKKIQLRGGVKENNICIFEYNLCQDIRKEHLKPDHQEFMSILVTYFFVTIRDKQYVKVCVSRKWSLRLFSNFIII